MAPAGRPRRHHRQYVEWYDFLIYGFLLITIGKLFFPAASELGSLLFSVATFGVGFVMRPIGAVVLGVYADRAGRRAALTLMISSWRRAPD